MKIKKVVLADLENQLSSDAIIVSNTSSLSISEMATALTAPRTLRTRGGSGQTDAFIVDRFDIHSFLLHIHSNLPWRNVKKKLMQKCRNNVYRYCGILLRQSGAEGTPNPSTQRSQEDL